MASTRSGLNACITRSWYKLLPTAAAIVIYTTFKKVTHLKYLFTQNISIRTGNRKSPGQTKRRINNGQAPYRRTIFVYLSTGFANHYNDIHYLYYISTIIKFLGNDKGQRQNRHRLSAGITSNCKVLRDFYEERVDNI